MHDTRRGPINPTRARRKAVAESRKRESPCEKHGRREIAARRIDRIARFSATCARRTRRGSGSIPTLLRIKGAASRDAAANRCGVFSAALGPTLPSSRVHISARPRFREAAAPPRAFVVRTCGGGLRGHGSFRPIFVSGFWEVAMSMEDRLPATVRRKVRVALLEMWAERVWGEFIM